jgi:hypothetical protein
VWAIQSSIERFLETMTLEEMNTLNEVPAVMPALAARQH